MQRAQHARGLRFLPKIAFITAVGLITAATAYQASAVDVFTDPVGFITLAAEGTNGHGATAFSYWGLGMTQLPAVKGTVGSVAGTLITDSSGAWTNNQYNGAAGAYEVEVTSGTFAGLVDQIASTVGPNQFNTLNNDSAYITAGNTYLIRPQWNMKAIFGPNDEAGLKGGTGNGNADTVSVWNPTSQGYAIYFYKTNTAGGGIGWRGPQGSSTDAGTNGLYIDGGLVITRRTGVGTNVLLVGAVKLGKTLTPVIQGPGSFTFAANTYAGSWQIGSNGLYSGSDSTGLHGGTGNGNADTVNIWNPTSQGFSIYFYKTNTAGGGIGWRGPQGSSTDASTNVVNIGTLLLINRRVATPFTWAAQQPY